MDFCPSVFFFFFISVAFSKSDTYVENLLIY